VASHIDVTRYTAITFDCYGTLIDWETGVTTLLSPWAVRVGLWIEPAVLLGEFADALRRSGACRNSWISSRQ
jgi:2-haloacid dehalogenase